MKAANAAMYWQRAMECDVSEASYDQFTIHAAATSLLFIHAGHTPGR